MSNIKLVKIKIFINESFNIYENDHSVLFLYDEIVKLLNIPNSNYHLYDLCVNKDMFLVNTIINNINSTFIFITPNSLYDILNKIVITKKRNIMKKWLQKRYFKDKIIYKNRNCVYFIHRKDKPYKIMIGKSSNIQNKRRSLQSDNHKCLEIYKVIYNDNNNYLEKYLHNYFRCKHIKGEWFDINTSDVDNFIAYEYNKFPMMMNKIKNTKTHINDINIKI